MQKLKLLIADAVDPFRQALAEELEPMYRIRCCRTGKEALELIHSFEPDAVVIDLTLPEMDGISVLLKAEELGIRPVVLAITSFMNEYVSEMLTRLSIGYVLMKPCDIQTAVERLGDLTNHVKPRPVTRPDKRTLVSNALLSLGMGAKLRGYNYLRIAIPMDMENPELMVTKELYPEVARICGVTKDHVERGIRTAIESAFRRGRRTVWQAYFGDDPNVLRERPSNGDFISTLAIKLAEGELPEEIGNNL